MKGILEPYTGTEGNGGVWEWTAGKRKWKR